MAAKSRSYQDFTNDRKGGNPGAIAKAKAKAAKLAKKLGL